MSLFAAARRHDKRDRRSVRATPGAAAAHVFDDVRNFATRDASADVRSVADDGETALVGCQNIGNLMVYGRRNPSARAPLAQLDRASVYGTEGYWFESSRVYFRHFSSRLGL